MILLLLDYNFTLIYLLNVNMQILYTCSVPIKKLAAPLFQSEIIDMKKKTWLLPRYLQMAPNRVLPPFNITCFVHWFVSSASCQSCVKEKWLGSLFQSPEWYSTSRECAIMMHHRIISANTIWAKRIGNEIFQVD